MIDSVSHTPWSPAVTPASPGAPAGASGGVPASGTDPTLWLGRLPADGGEIVGAADPNARLDPEGTVGRVLERLGALTG